MKYIIITLLLMGCAAVPKKIKSRKPSYIKISERLDACITKYIKLDMSAEEAINICKTIHNK